MELSEMTFLDVLQLDIFREELADQLTREMLAYEKTSIHGKVARMALNRLVERGVFNVEKMTTAYYHICHKEATGYSSAERQYITDVCTMAYTRTIRRLQNESEENSRNPLLRLVRQFHAWIVSKKKIRKEAKQ